MFDETKLIVPLVHLNGSGKRNLIDDYCKAAHAVTDAIAEMCKAYPHMRDYYPLDNSEELFKIARNQHDTRINKMREILSEINFLAQEVHVQ